MANGKGWLDCKDCKKCTWEKPWIRYCTLFDFELPNPDTIEHQHTVCSEFVERDSEAPILNGEVVSEKSGSLYLAYRRTSPYHSEVSPQKMEPDILYGVHYHEQILRPLLILK